MSDTELGAQAHAAAGGVARTLAARIDGGGPAPGHRPQRRGRSGRGHGRPLPLPPAVRRRARRRVGARHPHHHGAPRALRRRAAAAAPLSTAADDTEHAGTARAPSRSPRRSGGRAARASRVVEVGAPALPAPAGPGQRLDHPQQPEGRLGRGRCCRRSPPTSRPTSAASMAWRWTPGGLRRMTVHTMRMSSWVLRSGARASRSAPARRSGPRAGPGAKACSSASKGKTQSSARCIGRTARRLSSSCDFGPPLHRWRHPALSRPVSSTSPAGQHRFSAGVSLSGEPTSRRGQEATKRA